MEVRGVVVRLMVFWASTGLKLLLMVRTLTRYSSAKSYLCSMMLFSGVVRYTQRLVAGGTTRRKRGHSLVVGG